MDVVVDLIVDTGEGWLASPVEKLGGTNLTWVIEHNNGEIRESFMQNVRLR